MKKRFGDLPVGSRFCFRARRYEKVAAEIGRDEERGGNVFHPNTEVLAEVRGEKCEARSKRRLPITTTLPVRPATVQDQDLRKKERARVREDARECAIAELADLCPEWRSCDGRRN